MSILSFAEIEKEIEYQNFSDKVVALFLEKLKTDSFNLEQLQQISSLILGQSVLLEQIKIKFIAQAKSKNIITFEKLKLIEDILEQKNI